MEEFIGMTTQAEAIAVMPGSRMVVFGFEYLVLRVALGGDNDQLRVFTLDYVEREYRGTPVTLSVHEQLGVLVPA